MSIVSPTIRTVLIGAGFAAGTLIVAACQQGLQPRDAAAGLMAKGGFGLHYVDTGGAAKLAYGKANSDNVSLMLECDKGSHTVEISDVARGGSKLALTSAGERSAFGGEIVSGPGAPVLTATAATDAPALRGFRKTGKVEVDNSGLRYDVSANAAERTAVERFFNACERVI